MPFQSRKKPLVLSRSQRQRLAAISRSRTEPLRRIERSRILLGYADGATVQRCLDKGLQLGVEAALRAGIEFPEAVIAQRESGFRRRPRLVFRVPGDKDRPEPAFVTDKPQERGQGASR